MRSIAIALALPFISSAQAVISFLYPRTDTIWYRNDTVNLNWTSSDPAADTFLFRAYLSNTDQSILPSQQGIADSTNATATFVRIALPQVQAAGGYIVTLVNTTNETQVFATSEAFQIEDGEIRTSSSSSSAGASRTVDIPNANTNTPFPSSFPSQPTGAAGHVANLASISPYVIGQTVGLAAMFIGGAAVLL